MPLHTYTAASRYNFKGGRPAVVSEARAIRLTGATTRVTSEKGKTNHVSGTRCCGKLDIHARASCYSRVAGGWLYRADDNSLGRSQTLLECAY
jgi:hypothetical protein